MPAGAVEGGACPRCGGRGWVVEEDGRAGTARPCDCGTQDQAPQLVEAAGIPVRYRNCRLSNFKIDIPDPGVRDRLLQARSIAQRYVESFLGLEGRFRESGLLFIGPPGVGKTHLAVGVLLELIERYRVQGRFTDFTSLIHQIQSTFDPRAPESKRDVLDPVIDSEVLILDELGAQKPSPWVSDLLYLVINTRYSRRLPTLFTTNYRLEAAGGASSGLDRPAAGGHDLLASRIPPMVVSRLYEMAQPVVLDSVDFRREYKMHQHQI